MLIHLQEKINNLIQIDQVEREQFCSPPYVQDITVYPEKKKKKIIISICPFCTDNI